MIGRNCDSRYEGLRCGIRVCWFDENLLVEFAGQPTTRLAGFPFRLCHDPIGVVNLDTRTLFQTPVSDADSLDSLLSGLYGANLDSGALISFFSFVCVSTKLMRSKTMTLSEFMCRSYRSVDLTFGFQYSLPS